MRARISKVRITDNRPAGTAGKPAMTGLDHLAENQRREAETHDKFVRDYTMETAEAAWEDLNTRPAYDPKNPEHRWVMHRRAALARLAQRMVKGGAR